MRSRRVLLLSKMGGSFWGQQFSFSRLKIKKVFKVILSALLILAVASSFLFIMVINYLQLEVMGQMGNFKGASIFFASFLAFLIPFIFSLLGAGGTIFRGKELLLLMPLPIDPTELYASRVLRHYKHNIYFYLLLLPPGVRGPLLLQWLLIGSSFIGSCGFASPYCPLCHYLAVDLPLP